MRWLAATIRLRERGEAGVLVTVTAVRGHAPRDAGAKMVVTATGTWDTIGGGALEAVAIERSRAMLAAGASVPETSTSTLSEHVVVGAMEHGAQEHGAQGHGARNYGVQCCGGEVSVLLEPLGVAPTVAVFGLGHVGHELARILSRHDLDLHLVDTRAEQLTPGRLGPIAEGDARIHVHAAPVLPEAVLVTLPAGAHVLVMTHDHAEDAAIVDAALRTPGLGSIGLIGSSAKWTRLRRRLLADGLSEGDVARVTTPIGLPELTGKDPAVIAVSVAADLLVRLTADRVGSRT